MDLDIESGCSTDTFNDGLRLVTPSLEKGAS